MAGMELLILDCDGTLFDTKQDIADAVNHARRVLGYGELSLQAVTGMVGDGISILAQRAFQGLDVDPDEARRVIMEYYSAHPADRARLYHGVRETLGQIEAIRTIISNKPKPLVDLLLNKHGIAEMFHFVSGGECFERKKPDPMAVEFMIEKFGISREAVLVVGDHSPDIEMAKRAGVRSVYCNFGFFGKDRIGADFHIDSFPELLDIVKSV
jgi:phosphoglycolate phosphatase